MENATEEKHESFNEKNMVLKEVYETTSGEELNCKITQTELTNRTNKYQESWKIINNITVKKATTRVILKENSKDGHCTKNKVFH